MKGQAGKLKEFAGPRDDSLSGMTERWKRTFAFEPTAGLAAGRGAKRAPRRPGNIGQCRGSFGRHVSRYFGTSDLPTACPEVREQCRDRARPLCAAGGGLSSRAMPIRGLEAEGGGQ